MTDYAIEMRGFVYRRITADMTPKEASEQYDNFIRLGINPDTGVYDPECDLDTYRVMHALETGETKSRSWARKYKRRLDRESAERHRGKTDQETAEIYASTFKPKH